MSPINLHITNVSETTHRMLRCRKKSSAKKNVFTDRNRADNSRLPHPQLHYYCLQASGQVSCDEAKRVNSWHPRHRNNLNTEWTCSIRNSKDEERKDDPLYQCTVMCKIFASDQEKYLAPDGHGFAMPLEKWDSDFVQKSWPFSWWMRNDLIKMNLLTKYASM